MHLYDELRKLDLGAFPTHRLPGGHQIAVSLNEILKSAVRYKIDNVATYYHQHDRTFWDLADPSHFPSLAPPHPITWLEYRMPTRYQLETGPAYRPELKNFYSGALVNAIDRRQLGDEFFGEMDSDTRWLLQCFLVVGQKNHKPFWGGDGAVLAVADDGAIGRDETGGLYFRVFIQSGHVTGEHQSSLAQAVKPFLLTFAFLHASNVIIVDNDPRPKKAAKKHKKRREYTPYRTLEIAPLRDVLRVRNRGSSGTGRRLSSVSITRGHFRTYPDDGQSKGLFGRGIYGTFWVPSHVKGRGADQARDREVKL